MPYSSRILVAALLLSTAQPSLKALALPVPALVAQTPTTLPVPGTVPASDFPQPAEELILAQEADTPTAPTTTAPSSGFAWWWLLPIAAGLGALGWAVRRGSESTATTSVEPEPVVAETPTTEIPATESPAPEPAPEPTLVKAPAPPAPAAEVSPEPISEPSAPEPSAPEPSAPEPSVTETLAEGAPPEEVESAPALAPEPAPTTDLNPAPVVATPTAEALAEPPDEVSTPLGDIPIPQPSAVPVIAIAGAAGLAAGAAASMASTEDQSAIEARKFDVVGQPTDGSIDLSSIDDGLPPLPDGYGESRIVLMPRDPQWAYLYWDIPHTHKENLRRQGGERLALRLYDVTDIDRNYQAPHGMQQCDCDELARDWYLQIPVSDRDYQAEIGYLTHDGRWLLLARSNTIRIPPIYPSDWSEDHFKTVTWEEDLRGKTLMTLVDPSQKSRSLHEQMYALSQAGEAERVDGSIYGSMQHVPGSVPHVPGSVSHVAGSIQQVPGSIQHVAGSMAPYQSAESSYAWGASGAGLLHGMPGQGGAVPTMSGIGMMSGVGMGVTMSGIGMMSGVGMGVTMSGAGMSGVGMSGIGMSGIGMSGMNVSGLNMSGLNMSGLSGLTMSGVGFSASMPPARPRQFWLVADAELIVYGATEADATVTIAGQPTQLSPEGTFRVHTSFPDGNIDYPIMAVAADGEQSRSIHMTFDRQTPDRRTNTKEEAQDEWFEG